MRSPSVWLAVVLAAGTACGGGDGDGYTTGTGGGGGGGSTSNSIAVRNNQFAPPATTVPPGTTVTWTWAAGVANHDVTFSDGPASPTQNAGTFQRAFAAAGTFPYHCTQHAGMNGTITVK